VNPELNDPCWTVRNLFLAFKLEAIGMTNDDDALLGALTLFSIPRIRILLSEVGYAGRTAQSETKHAGGNHERAALSSR
jgi:hypothetical protein